MPAYKRKKICLDDVANKDLSHEQNSKLSINIDEKDGPRFEKNNSFFHGNVD